MTIKLEDGENKTDLFVTPTDTHQFLDRKSCIRITGKRQYPRVQLQGLTEFVQITKILIDCKDFGKGHMERGSNNKKMGKQILVAQEHSRNDILEKEATDVGRKSNIQHHLLPCLRNCIWRNCMEELHISLSPNKERTNH